MTKFIQICLLIMPWIFIPVKTLGRGQFRIPQGVFLLLIFMGIIVAFLTKGGRNIYRNKYLGMFVGYLFFSISLYFIFPMLFKKPSPNFMILPMMYVFLGAFAIYACLSTLEKDDYIAIGKALCLSSILIAGFGMLQYFGFDPLKSSFPGLFISQAKYNCGNIMGACLDNPNLVGHYLALCSPLFLYFALKDRKYIIGYLFIGLATYFTKSHISWVAFVISFVMFTFLLFRDNKKIRLGILLTLLTVIVTLNLFGKTEKLMKLDTNFGRRFDCWIAAEPILKINPLLGLGLGVFKTARLHTINENEMGDAIWFEMHNDYYQYMIEFGLIGLLLLLMLIVNSIRNYTYKEGIGNAFFCMFCTFLFLMMCSFPWEVPTLALLGLLAFSGVERL